MVTPTPFDDVERIGILCLQCGEDRTRVSSLHSPHTALCAPYILRRGAIWSAEAGCDCRHPLIVPMQPWYCRLSIALHCISFLPACLLLNHHLENIKAAPTQVYLGAQRLLLLFVAFGTLVLTMPLGSHATRTDSVRRGLRRALSCPRPRSHLHSVGSRPPPMPPSLPGLLVRICVGIPPRWELMWQHPVKVSDTQVRHHFHYSQASWWSSFTCRRGA